MSNYVPKKHIDANGNWSLLQILLSNLYACVSMGLMPDTQNCGLRMRRECRERFPATAG